MHKKLIAGILDKSQALTIVHSTPPALTTDPAIITDVGSLGMTQSGKRNASVILVHDNGERTNAIILTKEGLESIGITDLDAGFKAAGLDTRYATRLTIIGDHEDVLNEIILPKFEQAVALLDAIIKKNPHLKNVLGFYNSKESSPVAQVQIETHQLNLSLFPTSNDQIEHPLPSEVGGFWTVKGNKQGVIINRADIGADTDQGEQIYYGPRNLRGYKQTQYFSGVVLAINVPE